MGPGLSGVGCQDGKEHYSLNQFVNTNGSSDLLCIVLYVQYVHAVLLCVKPLQGETSALLFGSADILH